MNDMNFIEPLDRMLASQAEELRECYTKISKREVVTHPGAVLILPIIDQDHLVMIKNERFAVGQTLWELPAGTLEKNEEPIDTAKRELIEESGFRAGKIDYLCSFYTTPGFTNELMICYVATKLVLDKQNLDENERITVEIVKWDKALKMIKEGTIIDGKTIAALLYYKAFVK